MANLAIIPARGGSKRILRKNIKCFIDKPIIYYSISAAKQSNLFDEIMVSTDDDEIANLSLDYGASVPFRRSPKNSDDHATITEVANEVLKFYAHQNKYFDNFCVIYPTAPLIKISNILKAYNLLIEKKFSMVHPIVKYSYPIQRCLKYDDGKIKMLWKKYLKVRSQDVESIYHDAGQFFWAKSKEFIDKDGLFSDNNGAIVLSNLEVQDIDSIEDWKIAEIKYNLLFP